MSFQISMKRFREAVNNIEDQRDSALIKTAYLLGARNSEILTKVNPVELLNNKTKPYGAFLKTKFANYEVAAATPEKEAVTVKTLVVSMAVAKRGKRLKKPKEGEETTLELKEEEVIEALRKFKQPKLLKRYEAGDLEIDPLLIKVLLGEVTLRVVALPCSKEYEPWVKDLVGWMIKHRNHKLSFDLTRRRFTQILRENLSSILPKISKDNLRNPLRHYRIAHLFEYYNFNPMQITNYVGWSISSTAKQTGIPASANLDRYIHFRWQGYFPKLLKRLDTLIN